MFQDIMEIIGLILVMAVIFALTWLTTRFMSKRLPGTNKTSLLQIVERLPLGKDRQIAVVRVGSEHFMVGISGQQISFGPKFSLEQPAAVAAREDSHEQQDV